MDGPINNDLIRRLRVEGLRSVVDWCMRVGFISEKYECPECGAWMKLSAKAGSLDGFEWRCRRDDHNSKRSIRKGSSVSLSKLSMTDIMLLTLNWVMRLPAEMSAMDRNVSGNTVTDWKKPIPLKVRIRNLRGNFEHNVDGRSNHDIAGRDVFFEIVEPEDLRYTYRTRPAKDFGAPFNSSLFSKSSKLVPVDPPDACSALFNSYELYGNVALIERGTCSFLSKTLRAEEAGAKAVIISDNVATDEYYAEMIDDQSGREVNIPATFLLGKNGFVIRETLHQLHLSHAVINIPVNVTYVPLNQWKQPPWLPW